MTSNKKVKENMMILFSLLSIITLILGFVAEDLIIKVINWWIFIIGFVVSLTIKITLYE
jgi:hypothetical protein